MISKLITPHSGSLVNLLVDQERMTEFKDLSRDWPSWDLRRCSMVDWLADVAGVSLVMIWFWVRDLFTFSYA